MSHRLQFAAFAMIFVALLLWGIFTGEMPSKLGSFQKDKQPALYWISASLIGLFALLCVVAAIRPI